MIFLGYSSIHTQSSKGNLVDRNSRNYATQKSSHYGNFLPCPLFLKMYSNIIAYIPKHIIRIYWLANTELICTTYFVSKQISCSRFCKTLEEVALGLYLTSCLFPLFINVVWDWFNLSNLQTQDGKESKKKLTISSSAARVDNDIIIVGIAH